MRGSLKVGKLLGVPIYIHLSFLLILPLFAVSFGFANVSIFSFILGFGGLPIDNLTKILLGLVAAILFFISVLLHELAHSYVAQKYGYKISGITLFIFGGVSEIESTPPNAPGEALMAFVGPASSFIIGLVLLPFWYLTSGSTQLSIEIISIGIGLLSFYNILLGGFNIIPAFPMDGGRILRAVLVKRLGFLRATETAVAIGKGVALVIGLFGALTLDIWLILIAFFLYFGANEEERGTRLTATLEGLTVGDIMTKDVHTVSKDMSVKDLMDRIMVDKHLGYPVMDSDKVIGTVSLKEASRVPSERQATTRVMEIMSHEIVTVKPDTSAVDAVQTIGAKGVGRMMVMDNGKLVGIISRTDLARVLEIRTAERRLTDQGP